MPPDDYITLLEAVPYFLTRPHKNSIVRWADKGCYGVKLRTVRYGGKRLTTKPWVEEFNQAVLGATPDVYADSSATSSSQQAAKARLDELLAKTPAHPGKGESSSLRKRGTEPNLLDFLDSEIEKVNRGRASA